MASRASETAAPDGPRVVKKAKTGADFEIPDVELPECPDGSCPACRQKFGEPDRVTWQCLCDCLMLLIFDL